MSPNQDRLIHSLLGRLDIETTLFHLGSTDRQHRLREAYFVAIVTPSLKHLRREIERRTPATTQAKSLIQAIST